MHGVLVTANIASGQFEAARKGLREEVLPRVKQAPGLVKGFWTRNADGTQGVYPGDDPHGRLTDRRVSFAQAVAGRG